MKKYALSFLFALLPSLTMAAQECSINMQKTAPNIRYQFNDNGTVNDRISGLTWMRCQLGKTWNKKSQACEGEGNAVFWQAALTEVQAINSSESHKLYHFGGKTKWRLPNIKELVSLTEHACRTPALNGKAFNGAFPYVTNDGNLKAYIWSNTPSGNGNILVYNTPSGEIYSHSPSGNEYSVLLVSDE